MSLKRKELIIKKNESNFKIIEPARRWYVLNRTNKVHLKRTNDGHILCQMEGPIKKIVYLNFKKRCLDANGLL